jgi:hypothetical protein
VTDARDIAREKGKIREDNPDARRFMTVDDVSAALSIPRRKVMALPVTRYDVGRSPIFARKDLEDAGLIERGPIALGPPPVLSWVYFVTYADKVKIGTARSVKKRFAELQCGSPVILRLAGQMPGDNRDERELHERWNEYRLHGEWFRLNPEIRKFIRDLGS